MLNSNTLNVALIQTDLAWENQKANKQNIANKVSTISNDVDLIILPELFTSGFTMNANAVAEPMHGKTISWLKTLAKEKNAAITGSLVIKDNNNYYNRLVFVTPLGKVLHYDKRHSFTLAGEHKVYTAGQKKVIINYNGWKICPLICYDLRFPVWARNVEDYDVLLYVANWPKPRINAWDALLKARAIENMCYCIGVNRVGLDANKHNYLGHSAVYDVLGNNLNPIIKNEDAIINVTLKKSEIEQHRNQLNFLNDRDAFNLEV